MNKFSSYNPELMPHGFDEEIYRLQAQALLTWFKESAKLLQFGLEDGFDILEIGSGPGFITERLMDLCPNSFITCLELDPNLTSIAKAYLKRKGYTRFRIVQGSAHDICFADKTFDFAYARFVMQHLSDPLEAAKEVRRILKSTSRFITTEIDDGLPFISDPPLAYQNLIENKISKHYVHKGADRFIGRKIWNILTHAGFTNLDLQAMLIHSGELKEEHLAQQLNPKIFEHWIKDGLLSREEFKHMMDSYNEFMLTPNKFILMTFLMICGESF